VYVYNTMKILVYVLCPTEDAFVAASDEYEPFEWAKPIMLPQDQPYLENHMYVSYLMQHESTWMDVDWVGCIAWSASKKQPHVKHVAKVCADASSNDSDFVALMYRGDPLVRTAEHWHPGFTRAWRVAWACIGWNDTEMVVSDAIPSFYCNYWVSSPAIMRKYCRMMAYFVQQIDASPDVRRVLWKDSGYHERGTEIAKMTTDECLDRFGVEYYPMVIFVMERMICLFASKVAKNIVALR
jgi:hypothetical protein